MLKSKSLSSISFALSFGIFAAAMTACGTQPASSSGSASGVNEISKTEATQDVVSDSGATTTVPEGVWGGEGIRMNVTKTGTVVTLACGRANIQSALTLDNNHAFHQTGTYTEGVLTPHPEADAATFTGTVDMSADPSDSADSKNATDSTQIRAQTMTLVIAEPQGNLSYKLTYGSQPFFAMCR